MRTRRVARRHLHGGIGGVAGVGRVGIGLVHRRTVRGRRALIVGRLGNGRRGRSDLF